MEYKLHSLSFCGDGFGDCWVVDLWCMPDEETVDTDVGDTAVCVCETDVVGPCAVETAVLTSIIGEEETTAWRWNLVVDCWVLDRSDEPR